MIEQQPAGQPEVMEDDSGTPLSQLVAWVHDAEEATQDARRLSERDRDYYDGKQFTAEELKVLRDRGQPDIVINRIQPKINFLLGWEIANRTDPRAFPRTPQDEDASEAATDALRYVHDATDLQASFSNVWEHLLIEGYGGLELTVEPSMREGEDPEIIPVAWPWDRLIYDPHSRAVDFADARFLGGFLWMDAEEAAERWPDAAANIEQMINEQSFSRTFDDRPATWVSRGGSDRRRRRVRIVQMYHKEHGQWMHCTFTRAAKLEAMAVPFVDQHGKSWCPLLMASAFVDRKNERYGLVRSMIGTQDEINKRRSKALHRLTMRQVQVEEGAVADVDATKAELAKPDGFIVTNPGFAFNMLNGAEQLAAELQLLQEAKNEIELMGPNSAMLGRDTNAPSGKAILANQQSGQTEISLLVDRHRHLKKQTYRRIWDLIRQYKTAPWWVRVTDDEKNIKFVGINRPVTAAEEMTQRAIAQGMAPEDAQAQIQQAVQSDPMLAQQLQQVVRVENQATEMFMDITVEEVPDSANIQMEQFAQLTGMAPAVVFPPEVYIEASALRNKKRLLELLQNKQAPDPEAAEFAKIQREQLIEKTQAEIGKLKADTLKANVEADMADAQPGLAIVPKIVDANLQQQQMMQPQPPQAPAAPEMSESPVASSVPPPGYPGAPMPPPG